MKIVSYILFFAFIFLGIVFFSLRSCTNVPWSAELNQDNYLFVNFLAEMKSMDPANSFYSHEADVLDQIYEPILGYEYLDRPYQLRAQLASEMPKAVYYDKNGAVINSEDPHSQDVAQAHYIVKLKRGVLYQPHPCFAKDSQGALRYAHFKGSLFGINTPLEFPYLGTRELKAQDIGNNLKRICDYRLASAVYSNLASFLYGMDSCLIDLTKAIELAEKADPTRDPGLYPVVIDYSKINLPAFEIIDDYTFRIICSRKFPQTLYWMAMHFMAPIPQEAIDFYGQIPMIDKRFTLNDWPVGTGPFMMAQYDPTQQILLLKNPNYRDERYPSKGEFGDLELGLLKDAGKRVPFVDGIVFSYEREFIPSWTKFLQGYFDTSALSSDVFDKAVSMGADGDMGLSQEMIDNHISMATEVRPALFYFAFNMDDPVVGGNSESQSKLRQAISIVLNYNEFIDIFLNGNAKNAQSPLPTGIYGHLTCEKGANPYTDTYDTLTQRYKRHGVERAKGLMREAGFEGGMDKNGRQLIIYLDHAAGGIAGFKAQMQWYRQRFAEIGIDLRENATDLNRYRDKIDTGNWQTTLTGWMADYPDPENFFFLFYGPNSKSRTKGSNTCNYANLEFDRVFEQLETMQNGEERFKLIQKANKILQFNAPVCFGYNPTAFTMYHGWLHNFKPHSISKNVMQYYRVDTEQRRTQRLAWNKPITMPIFYGVLIFVVLLLPPVIIRVLKSDH